MTGTRPKKVECLTCHGQHVYRASVPGSRKAKASSEKTTSKEKKTTEKKTRGRSKRIQEKEKELWKESVGKKEASSAKQYMMSDAYEVDDLIDHRKFGMGVVTNVITPKKIEVLFEEGYKCMATNFSR